MSDLDDKQIDASNRAADALIEAISVLADGLEEPFGTDKTAIYYALWCTLTQHLGGSGWTPDQLARDAAMPRSEQRMGRHEARYAMRD